ncbi:MAG: STAS domain-containing protein [Planctomycetota bacterium]
MATIDFKIKNVKDRSGLGATVATVDGSIDAASIQQFQSVMDKLVERGVKNLILDCSKVSYINSTGLGTLLKYADQFDGFGGHIAFIRVPNKVLLVMEMLGFNALFNILPDEAAALESFTGREAEPAAPAPAPVAAPAPAPVYAATPQPAAVAPASARQASGAIADAKSRSFPFKIPCAKCRATLNISRPGQYKCPRCNAILKVESPDKIRFFSPKKQRPVEITLPCDDEIAVGAGDLVASCARAVGMNGEVADQIAEAVTETCLNIIERALDNAAGEVFHVLIQTSRQGIIIQFADSGHTMRFTNNDIRSDEGFGAVVDRVDSIEHKDNGGLGNQITLTRKVQ